MNTRQGSLQENKLSVIKCRLLIDCGRNWLRLRVVNVFANNNLSFAIIGNKLFYYSVVFLAVHRLLDRWHTGNHNYMSESTAMGAFLTSSYTSNVGALLPASGTQRGHNFEILSPHTPQYGRHSGILLIHKQVGVISTPSCHAPKTSLGAIVKSAITMTSTAWAPFDTLIQPPNRVQFLHPHTPDKDEISVHLFHLDYYYSSQLAAYLIRVS